MIQQWYLAVGTQSEDELVDVARVGAEASAGIVDISFTCRFL